jgi:hypothetical protein
MSVLPLARGIPHAAHMAVWVRVPRRLKRYKVYHKLSKPVRYTLYHQMTRPKVLWRGRPPIWPRGTPCPTTNARVSTPSLVSRWCPQSATFPASSTRQHLELPRVTQGDTSGAASELCRWHFDYVSPAYRRKGRHDQPHLSGDRDSRHVTR